MSIGADPGLNLTRHDSLSILSSSVKGRGVYATRSIPANTVVEISPVLLVPASQYSTLSLQSSIFESYLFTWSRSTGDMALALGLGSLFNHDDVSPNVTYELDKLTTTIRYTTKRHISPGEELCIYYGHGIRFGPKGELLVHREKVAQETEIQAIAALGSLSIDDSPVVALRDLPLQYVTEIVSPEDMLLETSQ